MNRGALPTAMVGITLLMVLAAACSPVGTKGTMPSGGPNGEVDVGAAPDFIAVAGQDRDIVGYVPKQYLFPEPTALAELPHDEAWPVYAEDLRTLIGHMVQGKGFVPLGVDPNTVPGRPVQQGPSPAPPIGETGGMTVYVRNASKSPASLAAMIGGQAAGPANEFSQGVGVACLPMVAGGRLVLTAGAPLDGGQAQGRDIEVPADPYGSAILWIDINVGGDVIQGLGVPVWWPHAPQAC